MKMNRTIGMSLAALLMTGVAGGAFAASDTTTGTTSSTMTTQPKMNQGTIPGTDGSTAADSNIQTRPFVTSDGRVAHPAPSAQAKIGGGAGGK